MIEKQISKTKMISQISGLILDEEFKPIEKVHFIPLNELLNEGMNVNDIVKMTREEGEKERQSD